MIWGYTGHAGHRHVLAEEARKEYPFVGISLCGSVLRYIIKDPKNLPYWPICQRCETLLHAMKSV